jgi:hemolysin III
MEWFEFRQPVSAWTHASWWFLSIPATLLLCRLARGNLLKQIGFVIFGVCLILCYGSSTLWHALQLPENDLQVFATFDYAGIFALIAGTTTPILLVVLRGPWRVGFVAATWFMAGCGVAVSLFHEDVSNKVFTVLYLGMGWGMCFSYFQLTRVLGHRQMMLVLVGGLFYSVGAVLNWATWPVLLSGWVGPHEVFHLFVMAGTVSHFLFMVKVLLPFRHRSLVLAGKVAVGNAEPVLAARPEMVSAG